MAYTRIRVDDVPDVLGDYPGEMRPLKDALGTEQVALTYRRMPAQTGAKGSYGHRHREQEELIFVISGSVQVKVDDEVVTVGPREVIRIAPGTAQGTWNEGPEDAEVLLISTRLDHDDVDKVQSFWPAD